MLVKISHFYCNTLEFSSVVVVGGQLKLEYNICYLHTDLTIIVTESGLCEFKTWTGLFTFHIALIALLNTIQY